MIGFQIGRVYFERFFSVINAAPIFLHFQISHCTVAVGCCLIWVDLYRLSVTFDCKLKFLTFHELVTFEPFILSAPLLLDLRDKRIGGFVWIFFVCLENVPLIARVVLPELLVCLVDFLQPIHYIIIGLPLSNRIVLIEVIRRLVVFVKLLQFFETVICQVRKTAILFNTLVSESHLTLVCTAVNKLIVHFVDIELCTFGSFPTFVYLIIIRIFSGIQ